MQQAKQGAKGKGQFQQHHFYVPLCVYVVAMNSTPRPLQHILGVSSGVCTITTRVLLCCESCDDAPTMLFRVCLSLCCSLRCPLSAIVPLSPFHCRRRPLKPLARLQPPVAPPFPLLPSAFTPPCYTDFVSALGVVILFHFDLYLRNTRLPPPAPLPVTTPLY